ncbi:AIPR family protein [Cronobacter sakazakii]|uniref:AIPR family protein n=2 Tax=Cronobacter sakazakii TaxID=28141 RepID=UPI0011E46A3B|nr:AIPR family protein [Cronobacter sakazakii]MDT3610304.1 AIPR family protein [Cronobacter sakazakii]QWR80003.1 hypothetical protein G4U62_05390 [Cronobacter sakazakii]TYD49640.1 hypothetical protein FNN14_13660 [Cronobacter sakazakii]
MAALQPQFLAPLKELLQQRFVPHLPPLLGQGGQEDKPKKQISRAFSAFVLQQKFDLDVVTATKAVVDDYEDHGLDAIYYHEADQTLYLVQSKMKVDAQFTLGEAQAFIEGIKLLLNKQFNRFNQNVQNLQAQIETALDECEHIQLLIAYTGSGITMQAQNYLQPAIQELIDEGEEQIEPGYQEFTATDVEQALRSEHAVDTVNERVAIYKFRVQEQPRKVVFGIAKLTDLIALHTTYDRKLYEKNIRYFIGSGRRGVNKAIKDTLLHEPENFIYLNNGITLDGNAVKPKGNIRGHTGSKHVAVDGLSVVNGAQTIASAAQFMRENLDADISQAQVMVTIIHFTYCITTLLMAQFKNTITAVEITEQEAFERLISRAFDELRQKFSDSFRTLAFGSAPHAYFKRLSDTARLMQTVWVSHLNLAENPAVIAKQRLQPNDPYNRNLFSYLAKQAQRRQEQNAQAANRQVQQA